MVNIPVLYITFARPEYACQSFAAIKKAQPKKLYFYSNKARVEKQDEVERNEKVRSYVSQIDWDCEVKTWYREEYVDVFTSLWGAIDWIFENEEQAIIIEEDVVASLAFFDFMEKMLAVYKNNQDVAMISGNNALPNRSPKRYDCFATKYPDIYGWGSWKDRWNQLDRKMLEWPSIRNSKQFKRYYSSCFQAFVRKYYFNKVYKNIDSYNPWDFIFTYNMAKSKTYCMMPNANLAADIGINGANHTIQEESSLSVVKYDMETYKVELLPPTIEPGNYDNKLFVSRLLNLIKRKTRLLYNCVLFK